MGVRSWVPPGATYTCLPSPPVPHCQLACSSGLWQEPSAPGEPSGHLPVLRTWNLRGLVLCLVILPSFISLVCSGRRTRPGLQTWTSGLSSTHSLRLLSLLRLGPGHSPTTAGEPGLSLQPIQMPSPDGFLFLPVLPLGLSVSTVPLPSLSLCISPAHSRCLQAQGVCLPLP